MPSALTYNPPFQQNPAKVFRADTRDTRRLMNPLGIRSPHRNTLGYRYSSPCGDGILSVFKGSRSAHPTANSSLLTANWTYTFSAKEKDSETGLSYFGSRYYSSDLSIWLSVDPMSDKYPSLSPYVYCADNPVKLVDPNGEEYRNPPWILLKGIARVVEATSKNADVKTVAYSFNHPINAIRVGTAKDGGKNISSVASNFAINMSKAADLSSAGEGSQRNAIRHVLWQAMLTNKFGSKQAERIGNIHENGPKADLSQRSFMTMGEADKVVDQLNNEIGRSIGERNKGADNVTLAKQVADEFYNNGFWTVSENSDNTFSIHKSKISKAEYNKMINDINKMNNNGLHD